jgi:hypothetical protein
MVDGMIVDEAQVENGWKIEYAQKVDRSRKLLGSHGADAIGSPLEVRSSYQLTRSAMSLGSCLKRGAMSNL